MARIGFPREFVFGVAASAFQVEGSPRAGGKGPSIWDRFVLRPGAIKTGENAEVACDHFRLWKEDLSLMRGLGLRAYRGSISWPRIFPEGDGRVNERGLDHYDRFTDALLDAGIEPWWTLFHWDLPAALHDRFGGFRSRRIIPIFGDYVEAVVRRLGDRARRWITLNEPWEFAAFGHLLGAHAPGLRSPRAFFAVIHNELLAHGEALKRIRSVSPGSQAGITLSITPVHPFSERPRDRKAALLANQFMNHIAVGPLLDGEYPAELWKRAFLLRPRILPGDMDSISGRVDFIGLNNYQREWASWSPLTPFFNFAVSGGGGGKRGVLPTDAEFTAMGWEVWPQSIGEAITLLRSHRPDLVIVVTETGIALEDEVVGGVVDDPRRIRFLERSFAEVRRAMSGGADVRGIFVWSFMDNFEWAEGTRPRFGLVHVDFKSLERRPKASAAWYARVIREGGYEMGEAGDEK